jgi:integrase
MSTLDSTNARRGNKPEKPTPDFPLFAHASGSWVKKIRGQLVYFGPWSDPEAALAKYQAEAADLHAGRRPAAVQETLTVKSLCNAFLNAKQALVDSGELSARTFAFYHEVCTEMVSGLGKRTEVSGLGPQDFTTLRNRMAKKWGPVRLGNSITYVRGVLKFAYDEALIDRPARFGAFRKPLKKTLRLQRAAAGLREFSQAEVRAMIDSADSPLDAMILLGINCGFGNTDCARLPLSALDLETGWVDYPRPKTGIPRRCPLWPETVEALRSALACRPEPKEESHAGLVFLTAEGGPWVTDQPYNRVTNATRQLMKSIGLNGHRNFYALRHTFRTIADEARDQPAVDHVMGHESGHISAAYRERISDERLRAVADFVRQWLFGAGT